MLNKGDLFITVPKARDRSYQGYVFKFLGQQENNVYAELAGLTAGTFGYNTEAGKKYTLDANSFSMVKPNRDTLEAAGLVKEKNEFLDRVHKEALEELTAAKDKDYWHFVQDYIQWVKVTAVNSKESLVILAAMIESESKQFDYKDCQVVKSATRLLDTMEAIEVLDKFCDSKK